MHPRFRAVSRSFMFRTGQFAYYCLPNPCASHNPDHPCVRSQNKAAIMSKVSLKSNLYILSILPWILCATSLAWAHSTSSSAKPSKAPAGISEVQAVIWQSAEEVRRGCYELLHDDEVEFVACVNAVHANIKGRSKHAQRQRLGVLYFGWVGANSATRQSLQGTEQAARQFMPRVLKLQQTLKISDQDLCATVDGGCEQRLAQWNQMKQELATKAGTASRK